MDRIIMKQYRMITQETMNKLGKCFSDPEEAEIFFGQMDGLVQELFFSLQMRCRLGPEDAAVVALKQACFFTIFCRDHMDLIHQLVANLECENISEEEANQLKSE